MAAEANRASALERLIGPLVGILVLLFTLTKAYERAELLSYDWRLNIRNSVFGMPPMDPRLGTIDIDDKSIEAEGRYQDWTRDKYLDVISVLSQFGAQAVAFDVYFTEPSSRVVSEREISRLSSIDSASVAALLRDADYDRHFKETIEAADNVYLAQFTVWGDETVGRTPDKEEALQWIRANSPKLPKGMSPAASTIARIEDFVPPLKILRDAARGFAFAQTVADVDGTRRRYPLVYQYGDDLFPALPLVAACDYLQVPVSSVEVTPGEHVRLPNAQTPEGRRTIDIPIDDEGNMIVNWVGRWDETFVHFPHIGLRWAAKQEILTRLKRIVSEQPHYAREPNLLMGALAEEGFDEPAKIQESIISYLRARFIEQEVQQHSGDVDPVEFWKKKGMSDPNEEQVAMVEQIALNNRLADLLAENQDTAVTDLLRALPDYDPTLVTESAEFVRSLLVDGTVPQSSRPLYYFRLSMYKGNVLTPESVAGKVLFYGLTGTGTEDLNVTPFQGDYPMVGIYPSVVNTIVEGLFIHRMPAWINALIIFAFGVLLSLVVPRLRVLAGAFLVGAAVILYILVAFFALTHALYWMEMVAPMATLVVGYLAITIYGYVIKEKEKDFVQGAFGHYLAPAVVDQIMNNPDMINQLGGEERVMTSFFSDVASFSTISECLTPAELVGFINDYLSEMCEIVEDFGGTIDKFEGDAILAFFGAPVYMDDHAVRGCLSCIDQQRALVEARKRWQADKSLPPALYELWDRWDKQGRIFAHVRMGLTAGPMVVGNMGSRARTDYTMMGDTVNLAARFESGQKLYGTGIMVNEAIHTAVDDIVETRRLDFIQVVGKEEPVTAYEVLERKGELSSQKSNVLELFNRGLESYEKFEFADAQKIFQQALEVDPTDGPSALYADRCEDFAANPPEDLVFRAESK